MNDTPEPTVPEPVSLGLQRRLAIEAAANGLAREMRAAGVASFEDYHEVCDANEAALDHTDRHPVLYEAAFEDVQEYHDALTEVMARADQLVKAGA